VPENFTFAWYYFRGWLPSEDDLRLLYTIGDLLSITIERARLFDQSAEYGAAEERNRLAREIHDTLTQGLAALQQRCYCV